MSIQLLPKKVEAWAPGQQREGRNRCEALCCRVAHVPLRQLRTYPGVERDDVESEEVYDLSGFLAPLVLSMPRAAMWVARDPEPGRHECIV